VIVIRGVTGADPGSSSSAGRVWLCTPRGGRREPAPSQSQYLDFWGVAPVANGVAETGFV